MPEPIVVIYGPHRFEIPMPVGYTENYRGVPVDLMERALENAVVSFVLFQTRDCVKPPSHHFAKGSIADYLAASPPIVEAAIANATTHIMLRKGHDSHRVSAEALTAIV